MSRASINIKFFLRVPVNLGSVQPAFGKTLQQVRQKLGKSQEELAVLANLHRTAIGKIESGERDPSLSNSIAIADALGIPIQDLLYPRVTRIAKGEFAEMPSEFHVDSKIIARAIEETYALLDLVDIELEKRAESKMTQIVELANFSSIVGNIFGGALAKASNGYWKRNGPHKFPDLISSSDMVALKGIEVKVALEKNSPKGHLPKPGPHITLRYVLVEKGKNFGYIKGSRGDTIGIWEVRCGHLTSDDFSISNTEGDSGKTAVVSTKALWRMKLIYFDKDLCPYGSISSYMRKQGDSEIARNYPRA